MKTAWRALAVLSITGFSLMVIATPVTVIGNPFLLVIMLVLLGN